jgi:hypothetical protein
MNGQHMTHTDNDTAPIVTCARCKRTHEGFTHDQADGCAADITNKGIVGHYGSAEADMMELRFVEGHSLVPAGLEGGQMCDICIVELRDAGALIEHKEYAPNFTGTTGPMSAEDLAEIAHLFDDATDAK